MSNYPPTTRANFFAAVDKWQLGFIFRKMSRSTSQAHGAPLSDSALASLPDSILQLLLVEPSLLSDDKIHALIEPTIQLPSERTIGITVLGLTPIHLRLLSSQVLEVRQSAERLLPAAGRHPLSLDDWTGLGIQGEIEKLYTGDTGLNVEERWSALLRILKSGCLSDEVIRHGLLCVPDSSGKIHGRSIVEVLGVLLKEDSKCE